MVDQVNESEEQQRDSQLPPSQEIQEQRPPGEFKMLALLFAICLALFLDSLRSEGLAQGVSAGPGSIPQLVGGLLVLMVLGLAIQFFFRRLQRGVVPRFAGTSVRSRSRHFADHIDDLRIRAGVAHLHSLDVPVFGIEHVFA